MTAKPDALYRLLSWHDTALYFDEASEQIRHGPPDRVPKNLVLEISGRQARLIVLGSWKSEICHVADLLEHRFVRLNCGAGYPFLNADDAGDDRIAITHDGRYFSCEPDGSVVFNRDQCQGWETFRPTPVTQRLDVQVAGVVAQVDPNTHTLSIEAAGNGLLDIRTKRIRHERQSVAYSIAGPFSSSWSLAAVNRRLATEIDGAEPGSCRVLPDDGVISDAAGSDLSRLLQLAAVRPERDRSQVVIHQRWPITPPGPRGDLRLAYFFWEESRVPQDIIAALNQFEGVLVAAEFIRSALVDSGLVKPVFNIGYSPDLSAFSPLREARRSATPTDRSFTFLHVSALLPRKGVDVLVEAYARTFRATEAVRLVIKGPYGRAAPLVENARTLYPDMADIVIVSEDLSLTALAELYASADAMVLPARGEGFNIPAAEALAAGLKLIVTGYGGQMQFCRPSIARLVDYELVQAKSHFGLPHSLWAEPKLDDLCKAMREAFAGALTTDSADLDATLKSLDGASWVKRLQAVVASCG